MIVFDQLRGEDSKDLLEEAGRAPLTDANLDLCFGVLEGVPIYVTGVEPLWTGPSRSSMRELEGRVLWTLAEPRRTSSQAA